MAVTESLIRFWEEIVNLMASQPSRHYRPTLAVIDRAQIHVKSL